MPGGRDCARREKYLGAAGGCSLRDVSVAHCINLTQHILILRVMHLFETHALGDCPPQVDGDFFVRTRQWKGRDPRRGVMSFPPSAPPCPFFPAPAVAPPPPPPLRIINCFAPAAAPPPQPPRSSAACRLSSMALCPTSSTPRVKVTRSAASPPFASVVVLSLPFHSSCCSLFALAQFLTTLTQPFACLAPLLCGVRSRCTQATSHSTPRHPHPPPRPPSSLDSTT